MLPRVKAAIYHPPNFPRMKCLRFVSLLLFILFAVLSVGCVTSKAPVASGPLTTELTNQPSYWKGDGVTGPAKIVISLEQQRAYFYRGGKVVGEAQISTGRSGFDPPPG